MWIQKKDYIHNHFDSNRWNSISLRNDDVIISTYPKSGTTREQMTILQLIHKGVEGLNITELSPYVELCIEPIAEVCKRLGSQNYRRVIKGHLPIDYLPFSADVKYVDIWRSPFDVAVSLYNHHNTANEQYLKAINSNRLPTTFTFEKNALPINEWIIRWFNFDGYPYWSYWKHIHAWWKYRDLENVSIFHYADLIDLSTELHKRINFLDLELPEENFDRILSLVSFKSMKANSAQTAPYGGKIWGLGEGKEFFRKGSNGDWKDILTSNEISLCEKICREKLSSTIYDFLVR